MSGAEGASKGGEARGRMRPQVERVAAGSAGERGAGRKGRAGRCLRLPGGPGGPGRGAAGREAAQPWEEVGPGRAGGRGAKTPRRPAADTPFLQHPTAELRPRGRPGAAGAPCFLLPLSPRASVRPPRTHLLLTDGLI